MSLVYPYIRYNNKYFYQWGYITDNQISRLISQDIGKKYAFVITYQQVAAALTVDAQIEIYLPCEKCDKLELVATVMASALANLDAITKGASCKCDTGGPMESAPLEYFEPDYIEDDYI